MKIILLPLSILLFTASSFACSYDYGGNFLSVIKFSKTIAKAKVIERIDHTENGKRFTGYDDYLQWATTYF